MKMVKYWASLSVFIVSTTLFAQTSTSTPAPTKTPPVAAPETTLSSETTETPLSISLSEPFVQSDLSVLVGNVQRPNGFVWFNGFLYAACSGDFTLYEINAENGQTTTFVYGVRNAYTLYAEETQLGFDLWIPDFDTDRILKLDQRRGAPRQVVSGLSSPWGIAYLDEENFLVTNFKSNDIVKVSRTGETSLLLDGLRSPAGIVVNDDIVYFVNNGSTRRAIEWFSLDEEVPSPKPLVSGLDNATNLILGQDGYLYFAYALGTRGVVGRVKPAQCAEEGCSNEEVEIVVYTDLQAPLAGLTLSPDMTLYVHTIYRPEIYTVSLAP